MARLTSTEKQEVLEVLKRYGFSDQKIIIERDTNGYVNKVYFINIGNKKFVLRKSHPNTKYSHLKLEVKLLNYLHAQHFSAVPQVLANPKKQVVILYKGHYFTLQTRMPGTLVASWNQLDKFTQPRLINFFKTTALFSKAVARFPRIKTTSNKPLWYFVKNGESLFKKMYQAFPESKGKKLLLKNTGEILNFITQTKKEFISTRYHRLPQQLVHFDLHPGNVNYQGNKIVAVFDYDWARYDTRFSDLACVFAQSCYYYGGKNSGKFRKDRIQLGLATYRKAYGKSAYTLSREKELVKVALRGYEIYIFFWAAQYYQENLTQEGYIVLEHFLKTMVTNDFDWLFT